MAIKYRPVADTSIDVLTKEQPKTSEPEIKGSKTVKIDADKVVDEEIMIDYMAASHSSSEASKKTKEFTQQEYTSKIPADKPVNEIREEISKSEASRSGDKFTFKDIHQIATFIINAFDGGISILLNFIARDTRVSVYSLPVETKRQLADQLALILVKYQVKFKIEFLFFITLVLAYMGPVGGALKMRSKNRDKDDSEPVSRQKKEPLKREQVVDQKVEQKQEPKNETVVPNPVEEVIVSSNIVEPIVNAPPRSANRPYERKIGGSRRGGQKKASL